MGVLRSTLPQVDSARGLDFVGRYRLTLSLSSPNWAFNRPRLKKLLDESSTAGQCLKLAGRVLEAFFMLEVEVAPPRGVRTSFVSGSSKPSCSR
jgi:hypothetical protein